jgi:hypothetical protein
MTFRKINWLYTNHDVDDERINLMCFFDFKAENNQKGVPTWNDSYILTIVLSKAPWSKSTIGIPKKNPIIISSWKVCIPTMY